MDCTKTLRLRIKDKHVKVLSAMAREVNQVWNFCNETSHRAILERHQWLSGFDLQKLTNGFSKCEGVQIGSPTVQQVCEDYAKARKQFKRSRLRWRVSNPKSSKYSLGWIPFKARALQYRAGQLIFAGHRLSLWDSYGLADYELRAGSFSEDPRGRWYLNVVVKAPELVGPRLPGPKASVGIDLGLKEAATCSDAQVLPSRWYRAEEKALATAQRAGKKKRVKSIHAKIASRRKDAMHKFSTEMVMNYGAIFVGNVASSKLVKTKMAKSTLDAGWAMLKTMLEYKSHQAGIVFEEVNEAWTTQTCSACGSVEGPKGREGLAVREWTCSCGARHDRDVNAAKNILAQGLAQLAISKAAEAKTDEPVLNEAASAAAVGHDRPTEGIPALEAGRMSKGTNVSKIKKKVSDLPELELNWMVGMAEGFELNLYGVDPSIRARVPGLGVHAPWQPTRYWNQAGPLMARECMEFDYNEETQEYRAYDGIHSGAGKTHLLAAMVCLVTAKFGPEVEVPSRS